MRPRKGQTYEAPVDVYAEDLLGGAELDRERQAVQRKNTEFQKQSAARGVHPKVLALGRWVLRERNLEKRRAFIRECAKMLIECEDLLLEETARIGHNGGPRVGDDSRPLSAPGAAA